MWANAQRDGRPAEYRWRPLFNTAKFGWRPLLKCRAVTLPRSETCWNSLGCPKLPNRSQPLVGWSSPYCEDTWRTYCCLTSFFLIADTCPSCKDIAQQSCAMVRRWRFFCIMYFQWVVCSTFQTCIVNSHEGHTMCGSMVDIQSAMAEIRRGKKKRRKIEETTGQIYIVHICYAGRT